MADDNRPEVFDRLRSRKRPIRRHVDLCLDSEVADAHAEAAARLGDAEQALERSATAATRKEVAAARRAEEDSRAALEEASERFTFRAISRVRYSDLVDAHPVTDVQKAKAEAAGEAVPDFDIDTFAPALIAECIESPALNETDAKELWASDDWSAAELMTLFFAANGVNAQSRVVDLGKGFGKTAD